MRRLWWTNRIHDRNLTADFRGTYAENVRVFDLLLADDVASFGAARLRRGRSLVLWRWAIREGMVGPAAWAEAVQRAGEALRSVGPATGVATLASAVRGGLRSLPLRIRMARARKITR